MRTSPCSPPRVGLHALGRVTRAVALALRGEEACLVLLDPAPAQRDVRMRLDWPGGAVTELRGRVREIALDGLTARVDISGVEGDWAPFCDWLGRHPAS